MAQRLTEKVLLIGWDAADWKIIRPLLAKGLMPNLKRFMAQGVWGNLATLQPMLSPMLWTSIATGKRPAKHGIHGFTEPRPDGSGIRPVTSTSRTCKALWNMLTQEGMRTHAVGWFASHPAEPINGVCLSDLYSKANAEYGQPWPLPDGAVYPESLADIFANLRVHPQEIDGQALLSFIPRAAEIDQDKDRRLFTCAKMLAECAGIHAAATWTLEHRPWEFAAVFYDAIDHFSHGFMHYHPPRLERVPERDFELYRDVVNGAYCFHDLLLGRLLELAGDEATVIIVSDHGYHSDHLRPPFTPRFPAGPAIWHRPTGICLMKGPAVRRNEQLYGANVLDVTPTVLTLFGLPVGQDMDGRPWLQALREPVSVATIPSWEERAGECGMHPPERRENPTESHEALKQLIDLGYIEAPGENVQKAMTGAVQENRFNLARSLMYGGQPKEAVVILESLTAEAPEAARYGAALAEGYHQPAGASSRTLSLKGYARP